MGSVTSQIFPPNDLKEIFITSYMNRRGPTPETLNLLPPLNNDDDDAVVRHKFRVARQKQVELCDVLHKIDRRVTPCFSPCLITDFALEGSLHDKENMYSYTWKDEARAKSRDVRARGMRHQTEDDEDLGTLGRLSLTSAKFPQHRSVEEVAAYDVVKAGRVSSKEKRARSRPERTSKSAYSDNINSQRYAMSVTEMNRGDSSPPVQDASSEIIVEKIELGGKKSRKSWPSRELVRSVLRTMKPPTTFFLARIRVTPDSETLEADYRFNNQTGEESFSIKGQLKTFLTEEGCCEYEIDKFNNNLDEKAIFMKNIPHFMNRYDVRIFLNGYIITVDGGKAQRMKIKSLEMNPPTLVFDMSGLQHISATRNYSKFNLIAKCDEGDAIVKSFIIRGKNEKEVKALSVTHEPGTVLISVGFPTWTATPSAYASKEKLPATPSHGILKGNINAAVVVGQ